MKGVLRYRTGGLIFGGAYFRNFMVFFIYCCCYFILFSLHI